ILCRPSFAPWAAMAAGLCWLLPGSARERLRWSAGLCLALALVLAPWIIRNQLQLGRPIWASTHGGYTLLLGNNPHYYNYLRRESAALPWDARELLDGYRAAGHAAVQPDPDLPPELHRDQLDYQLAIQAIRQQPGMFLYASLVRAARLWSVLPRPTSQPESTARRGLRYLTAAWYAILYGLAAIGMIGLGRQAARFPWAWGLALCLAVTAMHTVYWSDLRMRAPLVPVLALLAAAGCQTMTVAWIGWRKRSTSH
ncbi:MAG: hypothetical protein J5I93_19865, partial [Pirellulaceae bacterium]|nr:hypothetical protein [Pirellulaceae bacterium]